MSNINMWEIEQSFHEQGIQVICGVDEAGRGPLAGPVCAAAVILPANLEIPGLTDSKKLTDKKRRELFPVIKEQAIAYGIGLATEEEIDQINILQSTFLAMKRALEQLSVKPELALIDGNREKDFGLPVMTVVKGDSRSANIAAASVLAKVTRDMYMEELACRLMELLHKYYPQTLLERYKVEAPEGTPGWELIEMAGRKRGYLVSGGEVNTERMSKVLLDEFRGGKLGKFTLEMPPKEDVVNG